MKIRKIITINLILVLLTGCVNSRTISEVPEKLTGIFEEKHWAEDYMNNLIDSGTMSGYPDGSLGLDDIITREEAASILYNLTGEVEPVSSHFSDLTPENWSYNAVNSLKEQGIIGGFEDGTFRPHEEINRAEFCWMIYSFLVKKGLSPDIEYVEYPDTEGLPAAQAIGVLSNLNIVSGYDDGTFKPYNPVTRGEAAKIISTLKNFVYSMEDSSDKNEGKLDIQSALNRGFSEFDSIFSFKYNGNITPQDVVDVYKENFFGTYFEGVISNLGVEVRSKGKKSNVYVKTKYLHTKEQEAELTNYVRTTAAQIAAANATDYDKIKAAHDLIVETAKYHEGSEESLSSTGVSVHSPYSIISSGEGVCQAYALLNYRILLEMGYNVLYVTGDAHNRSYSGPHAWNLVQLGGNWYHIDPTWDDPIPDIFNRVSYDYFLLTDAEMSKDHNWDTNAYPNALTPMDH